MLISNALKGYWLERKRDLSPATYAEYTHWHRSFIAFHGDPVVTEVTAAHVRQWLNDLAEEDLADKSLSNAWVAMSAFFTWAEKELGIAHPLRGKVRRPTYKAPPIVPYTLAEIAAILKEVDRAEPWRTRSGKTTTSKRPTAQRDRAIILTLLDTGIRASELCNLSCTDYDAANGRITIQHGKGDKGRIVYVGDSTQKALWRYLLERSDGVLFATRTGEALTRSSLRKLIVRLATRAGVKGASVHRFRHTFAVNFLRNGGNVFVLQELLGHARIDTVKTYVRLAERDLAEAQRRASPVDNWRL